MNFPLFWLVVLIPSRVLSDASDQICSGSSSWIRDHVYGEMNVPKYSTNTMSCRMEIEPNLGFYLPNQEFTLKVAPTSRMGVKIVVDGGGEFTAVSGGGKISSGETYCVDYDRKQTKTEMTFRAPAVGGKLTVRAICGTYSVMHVADEIVLEPGEGVLPTPLVFSTDPRYSFERQLHSTVMLRHTRNATHFSAAIEYTETGYISFGTGRMMVPSLVLIAVNPESNPGMPSVGLYQIINKDKVGGNIPIEGSLETKAGIVESSYEELSNGHSVLRFTQLIANPNPAFNMVDPATDLPVEDVSWAVGPAKYGMHKDCGSILDVVFASGVGGRSDEPVTGAPAITAAPTTGKPTVQATSAPTSPTTLSPTSAGGVDGGVVSDDRNFKFMKVLNSAMKLYFKTNATHGTIKLSKDKGGYLSIGVGKRMVPSTCLVAMDVDLNPQFASPFAMYDLLNMAGTTKALALTPAELQSMYGLQDMYFTSTSVISTMGFSIELAKQSEFFYLFRQAGGPEVNVVYAAGPNSGLYEMHPYGATLFNVDFSASTISATELPPSMMIHVVTMTLGWGVFIPSAVAVRLTTAKFGLSYQTWLQLHTALSCVGVGLTLMGMASALYFVAYKSGVHFSDVHSQLGMFVFVFALIQPALGFGRHLVKRKYFTLLHLVGGFGLIFLAMIDSLLGIASLETSLGYTYEWAGQEYYSGFAGPMGTGITCVVLIFFFAVLVVLKRRVKVWRNDSGSEEELEEPKNYVGVGDEGSAGENGLAQPPPSQVLEGESADAPGLEMYLLPSTPLVSAPTLASPSLIRVVSQAEFAKADHLVLFNGAVYDFTDYLDDHPGGGELITEAGKDITLAYNEQGHSKKATKLLKTFYVGELESEGRMTIN